MGDLAFLCVWPTVSKHGQDQWTTGVVPLGFPERGYFPLARCCKYLHGVTFRGCHSWDFSCTPFKLLNQHCRDTDGIGFQHDHLHSSYKSVADV